MQKYDTRQHEFLPFLPNELLFNICPYIKPNDMGIFLSTTKKLSTKSLTIWDEHIKRNYGDDNYFFLWRSHNKTELDTRTVNKLFEKNKLYMLLRTLAVQWSQLDDAGKEVQLDIYRKMLIMSPWRSMYLVDHIVQYDELAFHPFKYDKGPNKGDLLKDGLRNMTPAYMVYKIFFQPLTRKEKPKQGWNISLPLFSWFMNAGCRTGLCNSLQMNDIVAHSTRQSGHGI